MHIPSSSDRLIGRRPRARSWFLLLPAALLAGAAAYTGGPSLARVAAHPAAEGDDAGARPGFMARRLERVLERVGATPEQRAQVKTIWDGLRPQIKAVHEQRRAVRKQMMAAITAPSIDAGAVEKLRRETMTLADRASALMTQGLVATSQVLTPEQRKQAGEAFGKQGGFHGRGHGPRH